MASSNELALDIEEMKKLRSIAKRPRVVELISSEILNLEKNIVEEMVQVPQRSLRGCGSGRGRGRGRGTGQLRQEMVESEPQFQQPILNQKPQQDPVPSPLPCKLVELFWKQNPPTFINHGDPSDVEEWVRATEKIFEFLQYTDRERINCVSFQLAKSADYWWGIEINTMTPEQLENFTWEEFKKGLYDKYIPGSYWIDKEMEFYALRQGAMNVAEYDNLFCYLCRYAPHVDTDAKKATRFLYGLKTEIRTRLAGVGPLSYRESFSRASDIEAVYASEKMTTSITIDSTLNPQGQHQKRKRKKNLCN